MTEIAAAMDKVPAANHAGARICNSLELSFMVDVYGFEHNDLESACKAVENVNQRWTIIVHPMR